MLPTWQWIKNEFIQEIPDDIALCEYECRKQQCTQEEWLSCERRVIREEMPEAAPARPLRRSR